MATVEAPTTIGAILPGPDDLEAALKPGLDLLDTSALPSQEDVRKTGEGALVGLRRLVPDEIPALTALTQAFEGVAALVPSDPAEPLGRVGAAAAGFLAELERRDPFRPIHQLEQDVRAVADQLHADVRAAAGPYADRLERVAFLLAQA